MTIYDRIRQLREAKGMSQQDLADKLGYKSRSAINKIELGLRDISQSKVEAFAKALDTTPAYLMGWEDESNDELTKAQRELFNTISQLDDDKVRLANRVLRSILYDKD